jgi:hypothetical protein
VRRVSEKISIEEIGKSSLETLLKMQGNLKVPLLVFERGGIIEVRYILLEEVDVVRLHEKLLYTLVDLIRKLDPSELFVGYEGFYLMEERAALVLVGTLYSDDREQVWLAQVNGKEVGEWRDISNNDNRFGFEGLWKKAKAYRGN